MVVNKEAIELIKRYEGLRLVPYKDPVGIVTIGYGHSGWKGGSITLQKAEELLMEDIAKAQIQVDKYQKKYGFNSNQYGALVSFAFNIGSIDQLTAKGTRSIKDIEKYLPAYCKAGGKTLPGLVSRRNAELELFKKAAPAAAAPSEEEKKPISTIIDRILTGEFGNGEARKNNLYNYIQGLVNKRIKG